MNILQAIISGVTQGVTEFFPISSSGHLAILHSLFGLKESQIVFDVFLHFCTIGSIIIFFRGDILRILIKDRKTILFIIAGSVPTFLIGFFFKDFVEGLFLNIKAVGLMLMVTGLWLLLADFAGRTRGDKELGFANSILIGLAQGISVIPGISRSGATMATGILAGLKREEAFRFSFLLSLPAVLGANILKGKDIIFSINGNSAAMFAAGGLAAFITGIFALKALLNIVRRNRLNLFGIYCLFAGLMVALFLK